MVGVVQGTKIMFVHNFVYRDHLLEQMQSFNQMLNLQTHRKWYNTKLKGPQVTPGSWCNKLQRDKTGRITIFVCNFKFL